MSEELIVRHCSPTLAGIKTGNLFTCSYSSAETLRGDIRRLNRRLASKGLRILPMRMENGKALIYLYRPAKLAADLRREDAAQILMLLGYGDKKPERCIARLARELRKNNGFPHEIGLFLGYPPEDVRGFMDNEAQNCKLSGLWKVYGDEEKAKRLFAQYKKCTDVYIRHLTDGKSLERLTVAA